MSRTSESAKQADELEVREEEQEEEEEPVDDSKEGSEVDSPGSLFPLFGGGFGRGFVFWVGVCFVLGSGVCFGLGVGVCFGLGAGFGTKVGGWGRGGGNRELLAVSGSRGQVVNVALAVHLHLQDATTAG